MVVNNWRMLNRVGIILKKVGYAALALFMVFLAVMTYRYGGGFADVKAVIVMITMLAMAVLVGRLGFDLGTLRGSDSTK